MDVYVIWRMEIEIVGAFPLHRAASGTTDPLAGWEVPASIAPPLVGNRLAARSTTGG